MSRRYTLMAPSAMAERRREQQQHEHGEEAELGRNATRASCVKTQSAPNSTRLCRKKWTSAAPTAASGSASRGTRPSSRAGALTTIGSCRAGPRRRRSSRPGAREEEDRVVRDRSTCRMTPKTTQNTTRYISRVQQRPHEAEDAVLVLDLELLADQVAEQLAVLPDVLDAREGVGALGDLGGAERSRAAVPARTTGCSPVRWRSTPGASTGFGSAVTPGAAVGARRGPSENAPSNGTARARDPWIRPVARRAPAVS